MRSLLNYFRYHALLGKLAAFKRQKPVLLQHPALTKHVQALEQRLLGAVQFLKNTRIHKNGVPIKLNALPWYLIVGSPGSGKTSLLANSTIHFILEKQFSPDVACSLPSTESCDWWVTHEMVFVDVPGRYLAAKNKKNALANKLWGNFLALIEKWRGKSGVNGVIVALALDEFMQPTDREPLQRRLSARINELKAYLEPTVPIYFAITKCDLMPGFTDFFNDCSQEELHQPWGISLPATSATESFADLFTHRFNALIKRLNEQLIWRLHQEHNPYAKVFIKDFPLQVERLKEALLDFLKSMIHHVDSMAIRGVFLTSAVQGERVQNQSEQHPTTLPAQALSQTFEIMRAPPLKNHPYFIKQFLLHGLAKPALQASAATKQLRAAYVFTAGAALFSLTLFGNYFYHQHVSASFMQAQATKTTLTISPRKEDSI